MPELQLQTWLFFFMMYIIAGGADMNRDELYKAGLQAGIQVSVGMSADIAIKVSADRLIEHLGSKLF